MSDNNLYIVDSNVLITAKNIHYSMDFCEGFWEFISKAIQNDKIYIIDHIYKELTRTKEDELSSWIQENIDKSKILNTQDEETQKVYIDIVNHVNDNPLFKETGKRSFLDVADPWIIAKAKTFNAQVVTLEKRVASSSAKIKIPNICEHFEVPYLDTYELMRRMGVNLVLGV